jgi:hypothetical protein
MGWLPMGGYFGGPMVRVEPGVNSAAARPMPGGERATCGGLAAVCNGVWEVLGGR